MGIEDILMYDESLFNNINAFDPDYMPPNYNFRDTQMEGMAMAIRPAIRGFIQPVLEYFHRSIKRYSDTFPLKPEFRFQKYMPKS